MDRAFKSGAIATPPTAPVTPSFGYPTGGNPAAGVQATTPGDWWFYMVTEELRQVIVDAGITPDSASINQLSAAISSIFQGQKSTAFTTTGASGAFVLTPSPAIASYAAGQRFRIKFHAAGNGADSINVNSKGSKNLKQYDSTGAKISAVIAANQLVDVEYDGTDFVLLDPLPVAASANKIQSITASVASNALTLTLNPTSLDFRSSTLSSGTVNTRTVASPISLTISSGSTLGTVNAQAARIAVLAIDNAGTVELAAVNIAGGTQLDETNLISTTAEGGAGAADGANVIYSNTARTNVPYRVVGFIDITEATAGTWATAPTAIQGVGGQALVAMSSLGYGQTWQDVTASRAVNTTYYNTTGKPLQVFITQAVGSSGEITVGGVLICSGVASPTNTRVALSFVVPPGAAYSINFSPYRWAELR